jgi:hypothetical protein
MGMKCLTQREKLELLHDMVEAAGFIPQGLPTHQNGKFRVPVQLVTPKRLLPIIVGNCSLNATEIVRADSLVLEVGEETFIQGAVPRYLEQMFEILTEILG